MSKKVAYVTGGMGGIGTAICQRLHQMGFTVVAGCGPTRDFKKWLDEILEDIDHKHLNIIPLFAGINPSAENIAKYICEKMELKAKAARVNVVRVKIWESENAAVTYMPETYD